MIRVHRHSTGRVHAPLATSAAAGIGHLLALIRLGGLARQAAAATGRDRLLLLAEAYAVAWPVVFSRLSAAVQRSHGGYGTDATGLRPDSPERFEGDVQAMLAPLTPFEGGAPTAVGEGWTAHRPWAPWLIAALREDRIAWHSHGKAVFLDLLVIEHVRITAPVTAATDSGVCTQTGTGGVDTMRAVRAAGAATAGADRGRRGVPGAAQRPCMPHRLRAVPGQDRLEDWRADRRRTVSPADADAGIVIAWPDAAAGPTARPATARRRRCSTTPGAHAPGRPRCGTSRCRDILCGRGAAPAGTSTGPGRSSDPSTTPGARTGAAGVVLRGRRNSGATRFVGVPPLAVGGHRLQGGDEAGPATAPGVAGTAGAHQGETLRRGRSVRRPDPNGAGRRARPVAGPGARATSRSRSATSGRPSDPATAILPGGTAGPDADRRRRAGGPR